MNGQKLVSAVVAHAERQHPDSVWAIVSEGMRRDDIARIIADQRCTTANQARRAVRATLDELTTV